jgi:hypothetical protein
VRSFDLNERQKKFIREVGGVVLGVLIALGLGEVATEIRWRFDAADARAAMLADFELDAGAMHERQLAKPCIDRRLRDVDALIKQAGRSGILPMISTIGRPPTRPLVTASWEMGVSSGVLPHLSRDDAKNFSTNFDMIEKMADVMNRQNTLWAKLSALENAPGPVSQQVLAELTFTTAELRQETAYVDVVAGQIVESARSQGRLNYWMIFDRDGGKSEDVVAGLRSRPLCFPLLVDGTPYLSGEPINPHHVFKTSGKA